MEASPTESEQRVVQHPTSLGDGQRAARARGEGEGEGEHTRVKARATPGAPPAHEGDVGVQPRLTWCRASIANQPVGRIDVRRMVAADER